MQPDKSEEQLLKNKLFTKEGAPLRILSTSLGIALLANIAFAPGGVSAEGTTSTTATTNSTGPKLVEWSTEAVKSYYDPNVDWNLPVPADKELDQQEEQAQAPSSGQTTTIVHSGSSGFGWDDLMLYHLMFNSGNAFSAGSWSSSHSSYYHGSSTPYKPKSYSSGSFQNKPVSGSNVIPKTSNSTGSITKRSTSSSPGGIGGKSSGFSSSSSSSGSHVSSSHSSRGFGG